MGPTSTRALQGRGSTGGGTDQLRSRPSLHPCSALGHGSPPWAGGDTDSLAFTSSRGGSRPSSGSINLREHAVLAPGGKRYHDQPAPSPRWSPTRPPCYTAARMPPPLAGLRALDLTDALGHFCGRVLADLG